MSDGLAIAATTATLRRLLDKGLGTGTVKVSASPLDKARDGGGPQINLFLYLTQIDGAWRNQDVPGKVKSGETGFPPLPLALFYLLTAYHDDKDEVQGQKLLGRAMRILHDHPLLGSAEIKDALPDSDLHEQIERVRITLQPLPVEEISKLWAAFQTPYRTSVAYQVSLVLIESSRSAKAPLPVLRRGEDDRGVTSQPDLESPFPALTGLVLPDGQASARLGDVVTLTGHHLDAGTLEVRVLNPHLPGPGPITLVSATATEIKIEIKNDPANWVAGLYTVAAVLTDGDDVRSTNELPLTLAPRLLPPLPLNIQRDPGDHSAEIDVKFRPRFRPSQRAALLIGDREVPIAPPEPAAPVNTLKFIVKNAPLGTHFLRLRIDGVDSLLVQRPPGQPPVFDPAQRVTIHD